MPTLSWPPGPEQPQLPAGEAHVWAAWLQVGSEAATRYSEVLSADELERAGRFRFSGDRLRFLVARAVLRMLIGRYLALPSATLRLVEGEFGKPALAHGVNAGLRFNLAHSGDLAVYAFSRSGEVGIDVESTASASLTGGVPESSFARGELQALAALSEGERATAALAVWTRKEAYLKALGCGLQQELRAFEVTVPPAVPSLLRPLIGDSGQPKWCFCDLRPAPGWLGTLCLEDKAETRLWSFHAG